MMVDLPSPRFFVFILSLASASLCSLNILQIAPNLLGSLDSNYQLNMRFANLLATKGHYVHFVVPLKDSRNLYSGYNQLDKTVHAQACRLSEQTRELVAKEGSTNGVWSSQNDELIAHVEGVEVVADIYRQKEHCWDALEKAHKEKGFSVGLMDVRDFGALALFHKLGIKNVVLIQNSPLMSHMYDVVKGWPSASRKKLDYKKQIVQNGVPELFSTAIGDNKIGKSGAFSKAHQISTDNFWKIYEAADSKLRQIFNDDKLPPLREMFANAKFLFLNTMPSLDYQLGTLPDQVKFVGGIDLMRPRPNETEANTQKRIMFSVSSSLEPSAMPEDQFKTVAKALGRLTEIDVIWQYDRFKLDEGRQSFLKEHAPRVKLVDICFPEAMGWQDTVMVISECDIRTVMDVLSLGKPLLCIPLHDEQFYVAEVLRRSGAAGAIDPRDANKFTSEEIVKSIREYVPAEGTSMPAKEPLAREAFQFPSKETLEQLILDAIAKFEPAEANSVAA